MKKTTLIGINGKIGSGKDTIGSIIQYLTSESGNQNSSRHRTYEEFLSNGGGSTLRNFDLHYVSDWEIKKFAGKLKQIASLLTGFSIEMFEDQEFKRKQMSEDWGMTYREFLQKLGTEAMRNGLHTNVWVNALFADYIPNCNKFESKMLQTGGNYTSSICSDCNCFPDWIITDVRFPNELDAVVERKGITIRVHRDLHNGNAHISPIPHESETALDDTKFDYEIINDGTLEDLMDKVREILVKEKII
jgi:hypothetical protein